MKSLINYCNVVNVDIHKFICGMWVSTFIGNRLHGSLATSGFVLGITVPAIHGTIISGFERNFALLFAIRTNSLMHFPRTSVIASILKTHTIPPSYTDACYRHRLLIYKNLWLSRPSAGGLMVLAACRLLLSGTRWHCPRVDIYSTLFALES
jgi:hypothetical protein